MNADIGTMPTSKIVTLINDLISKSVNHLNK